MKPKVKADRPGRKERMLMFVVRVLKFLLEFVWLRINKIREKSLAKRMDDKNGN